ncbi:hypothetical protein FGG08_001382 [Glutinoglossum americanum]|uniref:Uncharacterized protein n=1 Tax=Glutinoglossum americanum TaxID=1670608 RepID=A0A9P8L5D6_9PEZI|nr:hypothetical protein FGG08_001382 [Glutinoglossum americanum]
MSQGKSTPKKQKTGIHTLADVSRHNSNEGNQEHYEPEKNAAEDDDLSYNPSQHSSEDITDSDSEDDELDDDKDMLGIPKMEEEADEIGSDMEETVTADEKVIRQKGGRASKDVEASVRADPRLNTLNKRRDKRFGSLINRTYVDGLPDKDLRDDELKYIVDFKKAERGARWALIPDENGDLVKLGDRIYREIGTRRLYKRKSRTDPRDKSFTVMEVTK